jgi:hypothetical protein
MAKHQPEWIKEKQAAEALNLAPRVLRRKAKTEVLPVPYTHVNGRKFQYDRTAIVRLQMQNSNIRA